MEAAQAIRIRPLSPATDVALHDPMQRRSYRSASGRGAAIVAVLLGLGDGRVARADTEPERATATFQCERVAEPGRVKCGVEIRSTGQGSIVWADVVLVELPELAAALKGRIGPADATARDAMGQRWAFGLVARRTGQGEARVRVRAVICASADETGGTSGCAPKTLELRTVVQVG
jgi:hypothetical protein